MVRFARPVLFAAWVFNIDAAGRENYRDQTILLNSKGESDDQSDSFPEAPECPKDFISLSQKNFEEHSWNTPRAIEGNFNEIANMLQKQKYIKAFSATALQSGKFKFQILYTTNGNNANVSPDVCEGFCCVRIVDHSSLGFGTELDTSTCDDGLACKVRGEKYGICSGKRCVPKNCDVHENCHSIAYCSYGLFKNVCKRKKDNGKGCRLKNDQECMSGQCVKSKRTIAFAIWGKCAGA